MKRCLAVLPMLLPVGVALAQGIPCEPTQMAKLLAADGDSDDVFGISGCLSGNVAVVGAWQDEDNGHWSGSAYVFRFDGMSWNQEAKLLPDDGAPEDRFGFAVSVDRDVALVGAYLDDDNGTNSGSVYVFRDSGTDWVQEAKLVPSDPMAQSFYGGSVSIHDDIAVVGAPFGDGNVTRTGSAYVFRFDGVSWIEEAKLVASDGAEQDQFGDSVSVNNNVIVIGASQDGPLGPRSGSAYVYRLQDNIWVQESKLIASDGDSYDFFGGSVSVDGDTAVIGASLDDDNGADSGSAYVFRFDGSSWNQDGKLISSVGSPDDKFGKSVSIHAGIVSIGAVGDDSNGANAGSAYLFRRTDSGWVEDDKFHSIDNVSGDAFGHPVCVSGDRVLAGGFYDDDNGTDSGSAYIFNLNCPSHCRADTNGDGELSPADFSAWVAAFNTQGPACDQNADGSCTPADFSAWVANFNAGC